MKKIIGIIVLVLVLVGCKKKHQGYLGFGETHYWIDTNTYEIDTVRNCLTLKEK